MTYDSLESLLARDARRELHAALGQIAFSDLTLREAYGILAIVAPVVERMAAKTAPTAPVVKLSVIRKAAKSVPVKQ
jgi:hypothetical protein